MNNTSIEWCARPNTLPRTWNPIRARLKPCFVCSHEHQLPSGTCGYPGCKCTQHQVGTFCTRISPGCTNCYASAINKRFGNGLEYAVPNLDKVEFYLDEKILQEPLKAKKPCTIFVGDMFDLFHEAIPEEMIYRVWGVMINCQQHVFQLLTKRPERFKQSNYGPLKNVWLGVSVESQKYADERIPLLLQTPAAVRFLSVEPQLEAVSMDGTGKSNGWWIECPTCHGDCSVPSECGGGKPCPRCFGQDGLHHQGQIAGISWVICGGESGPGARPFNLAWAESLQAQCKAAGTAFFMKQVGSAPVMRFDLWKDRHNPTILPAHRKYADADIWLKAPRPAQKVWRKHLPEEIVVLALKDRKGGDPLEWPESLRVREFPA